MPSFENYFKLIGLPRNYTFNFSLETWKEDPRIDETYSFIFLLEHARNETSTKEFFEFYLEYLGIPAYYPPERVENLVFLRQY